jgi:16S rRNA processing protein RimM
MKAKHSSLKQSNTGSPAMDEPVFVIVGKLRKPHGIRGEIRMTVLTDSSELITPGLILYVGESYQPYTIKSTRWHGADLLVTFEELPDRTAVEIFRNIMVYMKGEDAPKLEEGEYYLHQLIGLQVVSDDNQKLGRIKEVLLTGANDVYLVDSATGGKDLLIPATDEVVLDINWKEGFMLVHILPGLLDI